MEKSHRERTKKGQHLLPKVPVKGLPWERRPTGSHHPHGLASWGRASPQAAHPGGRRAPPAPQTSLPGPAAGQQERGAVPAPAAVGRAQGQGMLSPARPPQDLPFPTH